MLNDISIKKRLYQVCLCVWITHTVKEDVKRELERKGEMRWSTLWNERGKKSRKKHFNTLRRWRFTTKVISLQYLTRIRFFFKLDQCRVGPIMIILLSLFFSLPLSLSRSLSSTSPKEKQYVSGMIHLETFMPSQRTYETTPGWNQSRPSFQCGVNRWRRKQTHTQIEFISTHDHVWRNKPVVDEVEMSQKKNKSV